MSENGQRNSDDHTNYLGARIGSPDAEPDRRDGETVDVYAFTRRIGAPIEPYPGFTRGEREFLRQRLSHLREEIKEAEDALDADDFVAFADALVDLVYVAKGTAVHVGLVGCWHELWAAVHAANMTKDSATTARVKWDAVKPEGWRPPSLRPILDAAGYSPRRETD